MQIFKPFKTVFRIFRLSRSIHWPLSWFTRAAQPVTLESRIITSETSQWGVSVALRIHLRYSSNNRFRSADESVSEPPGLLIRRNSSKSR